MRNNDGLENLFRNRLTHVRMEVRDGFWEELQRDLPPVGQEAGPTEGLVGGKRRLLSPRYYRVAAAASVALVLGVASAAFWYFSPKEEIRDAFEEVAVAVPQGNLMQDRVQENFPSLAQAEPSAAHQAGQPAGGQGQDVAAAGDEPVSVRVSITITERHYGRSSTSGGQYYVSSRGGNAYAAASAADAGSHVEDGGRSDEATVAQAGRADAKGAGGVAGGRALKATLGTSLPKGDCSAPLTAGVTGEWRLGRSNLWLETGLQYNLLPMKGDGKHSLHTLAVPVKLNLTLLQTRRLDLYVSAGGAAEKCIAGAPDNSFKAEPVRLSAMAGLGVRYKLNDRIALFAEPGVSHSFGTDSRLQTLRTERPTNLNLLCGVRMMY